MRYIRKFEEQDFPKDGYWLLNNPTIERLEAVGYKFNLTDKEINFLLKNDLIIGNERILIASWNKPSWIPKETVSWDEADKLGYHEYNKQGLKYQGELIITKDDINNIGMKKLSRKFNV